MYLLLLGFVFLESEILWIFEKYICERGCRSRGLGVQDPLDFYLIKLEEDVSLIVFEGKER